MKINATQAVFFNQFIEKAHSFFFIGQSGTGGGRTNAR
jgi:hypothetical protein